MLKYIVHDKHIRSGNILLLTLKPQNDRDCLEYQAGQYVTIGFRTHNRKTPVRSFSIVSAPSEGAMIQVAMRIEGNFTRMATEVSVGATAYLQGPFGEFTINPDYDSDVVLMASGIGITPFISMIREARYANTPIRITLLYRCRMQTDIAFYDELQELERQNPHFQVIYFIGDASILPDKGSRFVRRTLTEERLRKLLGQRIRGISFFICGSKGFTKTMQDSLGRMGVPSDWIITESFAQSSKFTSFTKLTLQTKTYIFSGVAVAAAITAIMLLDLVRYVPKTATVSAQSASSSQSTIPTTSDVTATSSSSSTSTSTATPAPTNAYSQPVSSVS